MSNHSRETLSRGPLPSPLAIRLLGTHESLSIFDECGDEPISLRRKAQFFMDQKLYGRACQILELVQDLGSRDGPLLASLASLQILDGGLERARLTLSGLEQKAAYAPQVLLCCAEIERYLKGTQEAITCLKNGGIEDNPHVTERINELQVLNNT